MILAGQISGRWVKGMSLKPGVASSIQLIGVKGRAANANARRNLALGALAMIFLLACAIVAGLSDQPLTYLLVLAQFVVFAGPVVARLSAKDMDPFELIHSALFSYFLYFGGKTAYVLANPYDYSRESRLPIVYDTIDTALLYVLLGMICLLLGYYSSIPRMVVRRLPGLRLEAPLGSMSAAIVVMYAIGTGVRILLYSRGWYMSQASELMSVEQSPYHPTILWFSYLCTFAYALAAFSYYRSGRKVFLWLWLLMIPGEALYVFLIGSKSVALLYLAVPPFGLYYCRGRMPVRYFLLSLAIFVFVAFPVVSIYRGFVSREDVAWETFASDVTKVAGVVGGELVHEREKYIAYSVNEVMERATGIEVLTNFLVMIPDSGGFLYGETLILVLNQIVPTPLRPQMGSETMMMVPALLGFTYGRSGGLGITQVVELYWNFGLPGILVGMALVGIGYRVVYLYFVRRRDPLTSLLYFVVWWNLVLIDRWFWAAIPQTLKMVGIALVIGLVISRLRVSGQHP